MTVLRDGLLAGRKIALVGVDSAPICDALRSLGASLEVLVLGADVEDEEERVERWVRARAPLDALVYDAAAWFGEGGQGGLRASIDQGWVSIRAVASGALIPAHAAGKVVLIAPRPDAGPFAEAARAALENMARTLSVEWARYLITVTAIAPGARTTDQQLGELISFLLSPGGDYFSGCVLSLRGTD